jgi:hypothetical protein
MRSNGGASKGPVQASRSGFASMLDWVIKGLPDGKRRRRAAAPDYFAIPSATQTDSRLRSAVSGRRPSSRDRT